MCPGSSLFAPLKWGAVGKLGSPDGENWTGAWLCLSLRCFPEGSETVAENLISNQMEVSALSS